jgi:hypothetical protein
MKGIKQMSKQKKSKKVTGKNTKAHSVSLSNMVICAVKYYAKTKSGDALAGYGEKIIGYFPTITLAMMVANRIRRIDLRKLAIPNACLEDYIEVEVECRIKNHIYGTRRI